MEPKFREFTNNGHTSFVFGDSSRAIEYTPGRNDDLAVVTFHYAPDSPSVPVYGQHVAACHILDGPCVSNYSFLMADEVNSRNTEPGLQRLYYGEQ